jgi:hypothetical protein
MTQVPRAPLVIVASREVYKRLRWIYLFVTPFAALAVAQAVHDWNRGDQQRETAIYMLLLGAFMMGAPLFMLWARTRWVARMDEHGVTLRNGKTFAWKDYQRIEAVKNRKLRMINHYELVFTTGRAGVFHLMAENYGEVMEIVRCFEDGGNPFVGSP